MSIVENRRIVVLPTFKGDIYHTDAIKVTPLSYSDRKEIDKGKDIDELKNMRVMKNPTFKEHNKNAGIRQVELKKYYCRECKEFFYFEHCFGQKEEDDYVFTYDITDEIECPYCHVRNKYDDITIADGQPYTIFRKMFVNDNKIKYKIKDINFRYYNGRVISFITERQLVINMDTGYTYELPVRINGKLTKNSGNIRNITLSDYFIPKYYIGGEDYTNNAKSLKKIKKDRYNAIRNYKMKNVVDYYIPTYEQSAEMLVANYDEGPYLCDFGLQNLIAFNRVPALNIHINIQLLKLTPFFFEDEGDISKYYKLETKIRRSIKQTDTNVLDKILEGYGVITTKKNKHLFIEKSYRWIALYRKLKDVVSIDNIYKIAPYMQVYLATDFVSIIKKQNLSSKEINSICNKMIKSVPKKLDYFPYIISDTFVMYNQIIEVLPNYKINWKESFEDLHDILSKDINRLNNKNIDINYTDLKKVYPNLLSGTYNNLTFNLVENTHELIEVWSKMNICVGGYRINALSHECYIIVARDKKGKPIICIELGRDKKTLKQTKLFHNTLPSGDIKKAIIQWSNDNKLDYSDCYDMDDINESRRLNMNDNEE